MTLPLPTPSPTAALRERLAAVQGEFAAFVLKIDRALTALERHGDFGSYWQERKLDEISRELERWEVSAK
jgi:hypothetical protein